MLSGTDDQIDQFKGASSVSAADIRAAVSAVGSAGDVDGDNDFDSNDAFLIQLVQLAGTNTQIDQFKGSSPRSALQIRAAVEALGSGGAQTSRPTASVSAAATTRAFDFNETQPVSSPLAAAATETPTESPRQDDPEFRTWLSLF